MSASRERSAAPSPPESGEPARTDGALESRVAQLSLLCEVTRSFSEVIDLDQLIPFVVATTKQLLKAEGGAVLLLDEERQELFFPYVAEAGPDVDRRMTGIRFPAGKGIAGWVLQHGVPQLIADVSADERWYRGVDQESGMVTRSLLCAPLQARQRTVGVIELRNKVGGEFTQADLDFLCALARGVAVAIDNARLYRTAREAESRLREQVAALNSQIARRSRFGDIVGTSVVMQHLFDLMERATTSPVTVLLQGETGTGKELIAAAIHYNSTRQDKPFVAINCAALPEALLESELFGYRKGAFTGATADKKGLFEVADGGTLLLDEIGELAPATQAKLLRVLQNGEILPLGETRPRHVDVRTISATNRDLDVEVKRKRFREDLYYRLSVFPIQVPPLRDRREDIPLLAAHLLQRITERFGKRVHGLSPEALEMLTHYTWPGNVRELENEIERAVTLIAEGERIGPELLSEKLTLKKPARVPPGVQATSLKRARDGFEEEYIAEVLRQHGGNASRAAKVLGISRVMLQMKIKEYGLRDK